MRYTLFLDTTGERQRAVLLLGEDVRATKMWASRYEETEKVLKKILSLLTAADADFDDLGAIAVLEGPGGFSSTRIGVVIANVLGFALDIPVFGTRDSDYKKIARAADGARARSATVRRRSYAKPFYNRPPAITMKKS